MSTILMAYSFKIPVIWYFNKLLFPLYKFSPYYTRSALILTFGVGPFISIVIAFLFLRLFSTKHAFFRRFKLFYLWGFICGINMFFGAYIVGFLTHTEFVFASEWIFLTNLFGIQQIIGSIISLFTLLILSRFVTPLFLLTSSSVTLISAQFRLYFILSQVILPWGTLMVILFAATYPNYYIPFILKTMTPGLILVPVLGGFKALRYDKIAKSGMVQSGYFWWGLSAVVIALLIIFRIIFVNGFRILC